MPQPGTALQATAGQRTGFIRGDHRRQRGGQENVSRYLKSGPAH